MAIEAIQAQPEFPAQSEVRSSLSEQWRREIADRSPCSISDVFCLYIETKSYHWHMRSPHFRDYHGLLDEQAHSSFGMTDEIAERAGSWARPRFTPFGEIANGHRLADAQGVRSMRRRCFVSFIKTTSLEPSTCGSRMSSAIPIMMCHSGLLENWM